jgi:hypothetical protein
MEINMQYCLNVPFVSQLGIGGHVKSIKAIDDPTGCWYASACMIGYSVEVGPRKGVPELYTKAVVRNSYGKVLKYGHQVITKEWMPTLKSREQLVDLDEPKNQTWTNKNLLETLKKYGPIFFGWLKIDDGETYGHASVIIGVRDTYVIIHDPENRPFFEISLKDLNDQFIWGEGFTLRRAGNAFQHTFQSKNS